MCFLRLLHVYTKVIRWKLILSIPFPLNIVPGNVVHGKEA